MAPSPSRADRAEGPAAASPPRQGPAPDPAVGPVVVLGEAARVAGFALGGATAVAADDADAVQRAWASLPVGTAVVVLTGRAAAALGGEAVAGDGVLTVVMPP